MTTRVVAMRLPVDTWELVEDLASKIEAQTGVRPTRTQIIRSVLDAGLRQRLGGDEERLGGG